MLEDDLNVWFDAFEEPIADDCYGFIDKWHTEYCSTGCDHASQCVTKTLQGKAWFKRIREGG